jgi:beta-barrel assembly-enhancing protease
MHFFKGEMYRLRNQAGDEASAIEAYERALGRTGAPAETNRALALLFLRRGEQERARAAFERYLAEASEAEDRAMIRAYLEKLR